MTDGFWSEITDWKMRGDKSVLAQREYSDEQ